MTLSKVTTANNLDAMAVTEIKHSATRRKSEAVLANVAGDREGSGKTSFGDTILDAIFECLGYTSAEAAEKTK